MNTTELIEITREHCFSRQVVDGETVLITFRSEQLKQFAQRIEQPHKQRIAELELALQKQAKAALQGMDSAKSHAAEMLKSANEIQSRLNPELIESERQANAVLTEENEKLIEVVRQRSHKIAELEKDCEILQTNLDAALMQVKQLREALQKSYRLHYQVLHDLITRAQQNAYLQKLEDAEVHEAVIDLSDSLVCKLEEYARKALEETK